jgi:hypothetical protein
MIACIFVVTLYRCVNWCQYDPVHHTGITTRMFAIARAAFPCKNGRTIAVSDVACMHAIAHAACYYTTLGTSGKPAALSNLVCMHAISYVATHCPKYKWKDNCAL